MLAGYISGATVDLAKARRTDNGLVLVSHSRFNSRDFSDFESILNLYLKRHHGAIDCACFGVAGPVIGNEVRTTNLPWFLSSGEIQKRFSIGKVQLLNDIVALAYGLQQLAPDRFFMINQGTAQDDGNIGLIAAGSGLGEALIYANEGHFHPVASEGGHADFAPGSQFEMELWEYLYSELGQVEVEDVLSMRGLERIYQFVIELQGKTPAAWFEKAIDRPSAIIEKALSGKDDEAARAVDMFIDCYASEAANLALKGMTLGGLYLGGLIGPQIITLMDTGRFMERFVKKGKMESLLARMPVGIVIEEKTALLGAAAVALKCQ